jgi:DNA-binding MarR family transcriptional regulator
VLNQKNIVLDINVAIKQKRFSSKKEKVLVNLLYTTNWIRDQHSKIFKKYKILPQHYNVLRIVLGQDPKPVSPGYILEVMLDKKRDLTRLVDKLTRLGYLNRQVCENNRRMVDITITPKGKKIAEEIKGKLTEWLDKNIQLTDEESEALSNYLDNLRG